MCTAFPMFRANIFYTTLSSAITERAISWAQNAIRDWNVTLFLKPFLPPQSLPGPRHGDRITADKCILTGQLSLPWARAGEVGFEDWAEAEAGPVGFRDRLNEGNNHRTDRLCVGWSNRPGMEFCSILRRPVITKQLSVIELIHAKLIFFSTNVEFFYFFINIRVYILK